MAIPMIQGTRVDNQHGNPEFYGLFPDEEQDTAALLSDRPANRLARGWHSFKDSREIKVRVLVHTLKGAGVGAVTGAAIGAVVGIPGGPPGIAIGAGIGCGIGAATGAALGFSYSVVTLRYSEEYKTWKSQSMDRITDIWSNFIEHQHLPLCPITNNIIAYPVRAEDNLVYEADSIIRWIRQVEAKANDPLLTAAQRQALLLTTSPLRIHRITEAGLQYDMGYHKRLFDGLKTVYNGNVNALITPHLARFQAHVNNQRAQVCAHVSAQLVGQWQNNQITKDQFDQLSKENARQLLIPRVIS